MYAACIETSIKQGWRIQKLNFKITVVCEIISSTLLWCWTLYVWYKGGGRWGGTKWLCINWNQPNGISWCYFHLHRLLKAAKLCPTSPAGSVVGCPLVQGRWSHLKTTQGHLTSLKNKPQQKQPGQLSVLIATYSVGVCLKC